MNAISVFRQGEIDAHEALLEAVQAGAPRDEQQRLRAAWKLAAETFLAECDARAMAKPQVLQAAVEGAES